MIDLKPKSKIAVQMTLCGLSFAVCVVQLWIDLQVERPIILGFIFFFVAVVNLGIFIILILDLLTDRYVNISGKIVHIDRQIFHITDQEIGKLRRYKISEPAALTTLKVNQYVDIQLMRLSRIPRSIQVIEEQSEGEL